MKRITVKVVNEIEADLEKWKLYLNTEVGVCAFGLAIACIGIAWVSLLAATLLTFGSMVFTTLLLVSHNHLFPKKLRELRTSELAGLEELKYQGIERKHFSWKASLRGYPAYLLGYFALIGTLAVTSILSTF